MAEIQKRTFVKGLDSDAADEYLAEGKDRFRLNVRVLSSENGNLGAIETMNGNTMVTVPFSSFGTNTVIGSVEDELRRKNYFFVHNEPVAPNDAAHSIYEYDQQSNTVTLVLQKAFLNFNKDFLITGINVVRLSEDAHLLYWTDNNVQPRKINIEKAIAHTSGDFVNGYVAGLETSVINRIKNPPFCAPFYRWGSFTGGTQNEVIFRGRNLIPNGSKFDLFTQGQETREQDIPWSTNSGGNLAAGVRWSPPSNGDYILETRIDLRTDLFFNSVVFSANQEKRNPKVFMSLVLIVRRFGMPEQRIGKSFDQVGYSTESKIFTDQFDNLTTNDTIHWVVNTAPDAGTDEVGHGLVTAIFFDSTKIGTITTTEPNYLFKKLYTFQYQFVYDDFEVSAWSPISKFSFPVVEMNTTGLDEVVAHSNRIKVYGETGSSIVTRIRISAKEASETVFRLVAELDKQFLGLGDNSTFIYEFLNSSVSLFLEPNEAVKLFDKVPLLSQSQEFASDRIMDGLITEGFDQIEIDIKLSLRNIPAIFGPLTFHYGIRTYLKAGGEYIFGIVYFNQSNQSTVTIAAEGLFDDPDPSKQGTHLFLPFFTQGPVYNPNLTTSSVGNLYIQNPIDVDVEIFNKPPDFATHYQIVRTRNLAFDLQLQWCADVIEYEGDNATTAGFVDISIANIFGDYVDRNPDSKVVYDFADGDRIRFIANSNTATLTDTIFAYNEAEVRSFDTGTFLIRISIPASGTNDPLRSLRAGVWFEIYRPLLAIESGVDDLDQIPTFEMGECHEISEDFLGNRIHIGANATQAIHNYTSINVQSSTFLAFTNVVNASQFALNDKVKIVAEGFGPTGTQDQVDAFNGLTGIVGLLIGNTMGVLLDTPIGLVSGDYDVFGYVVRAAKTTTSGGDTFIRRQSMSTGATPVSTLNYFVEANNNNNMYFSEAPDEGRPNLIDPDDRQVTRPSTIIWSEKLIADTFINGNSSVFGVNFESYNQDYGGIFKLHGEDDGLIMFQERKIGKVLVDRTIYTDLQNNNTVGAGASVLSPQVIYYRGEFGIGRHPESFAVYAQAKYGIDVIRGVNWRLSQDGLTPISDQNDMHNFFTDKCRDVLTVNGKVKIYGVYDIKFNEYVIAFEAYTNGASVSVAGETLAWNELENQYSTFYGYVPENMVGAGINILTFNAGDLFTHNTNPLQSNFYGVQQFAEFHSTLNANPSNVKVLENISEESNDIWAVFEITTPNNQLSNLIEADFQTKENNQYAAVLRDENTPNITLPLIEGDVMRDRTFLLKFRYNKTIPNKLIAVNFLFIVSNRHNR